MYTHTHTCAKQNHENLAPAAQVPPQWQDIIENEYSNTPLRAQSPCKPCKVGSAGPSCSCSTCQDHPFFTGNPAEVVAPEPSSTGKECHLGRRPAVSRGTRTMRVKQGLPGHITRFLREPRQRSERRTRAGRARVGSRRAGEWLG
jgi:hypothetical protein